MANLDHPKKNKKTQSKSNKVSKSRGTFKVFISEQNSFCTFLQFMRTG